MKKLEIRSFGGDAAPKIEGKTIEGYAIVFNQRSEVMAAKAGSEVRLFVEIVDPLSINETFLMSSDIRALIEHNRERLLARYNKGVGTLSLTIDEHGLRYSFEAPNTTDGDYAVEMVKRGDISGSSFGFIAKNEDTLWTKEGNLWVRTIKRFSLLREITLTTDPAYTQTEVSVRSIDEMDNPIEEEKEDLPYKVRLQLLRNRI